MSTEPAIAFRALSGAEAALVSAVVVAYRAFLDELDAHPGFEALVTERRGDLDLTEACLRDAAARSLALPEPAARALRLALDHHVMVVLRADSADRDVPALVTLCRDLDAAAAAAGHDWS